MAKRKTYIQISALEAAEILSVLESAGGSIAPEVVESFSDLAAGRCASVEVGTDGPGAYGEGAISIGELRIDSLARTVESRGAPVVLTPKEFDILLFLASNQGVVFTKEQIYSAVWKDEYLLDDSNIMAFIRKLRKKIEPEPDNPRYILTVWGVGYKMAEQ